LGTPRPASAKLKNRWRITDESLSPVRRHPRNELLIQLRFSISYVFISVANAPGLIPLTVIPSGANPGARARVNPGNLALLAECAVRPMIEFIGDYRFVVEL
jgi:hypothetical protein